MQNKIVIAIVAILMAASFAGIVCVGDDSDAAVTSPITISTDKGDFVEGNAITYENGKVSGILKAGDDKKYIFTLTIGNILSNQKVYFTYSADGDVREADMNTSGVAKIKIVGDKDSINAQLTDFKFIVTSSDITPTKVTLADAEKAVEDATKVLNAAKAALKTVGGTLETAKAALLDAEDALEAATNDYNTKKETVENAADGATEDQKNDLSIAKAALEAATNDYNTKKKIVDDVDGATSAETVAKEVRDSVNAAITQFGKLYADLGQDLSFDLRYSQDIIEVRYAVGELVYVKEAMKDQPYTLVTLEDLNAPTLSGYKFAGWSYKLDEKENQALAGSAVSFGDNIVLTAVFEDITPVVTFAVDGVVVPELTKTIKYGEKVTAPDFPEGCIGWDFDFTQAIFADVQIDAVLEEIPEPVIKVTFENGEYIYYSTVPGLEVPTIGDKPGFNFIGWLLDGKEVDPLTYEFTEDTTLVAGWDPVKCKVIFMVGGVIYKEQTVEYGKTATEAVLPEGYSAWDFDFTTLITEDLTVITAIEKAPEKPTGLADPTVKMALVVVGLFICVLLAVIILKREDIRAGMVRKLSKADEKEDKKE